MAVRRVLFISQAQAVRMRPPKSTLLVSITDPGRPLATLQAGWQAILRLQFHDVDELTFPGQNNDLAPITMQHAEELASFLRRHSPQASRLIIHCKSGVSRSAGVARAAATWLGAKFPADYAEYNRQVHHAVSVALSTTSSVA
jgi:predicted protein tyrosine phosphatase